MAGDERSTCVLISWLFPRRCDTANTANSMLPRGRQALSPDKQIVRDAVAGSRTRTHGGPKHFFLAIPPYYPPGRAPVLCLSAVDAGD